MFNLVFIPNFDHFKINVTLILGIFFVILFKKSYVLVEPSVEYPAHHRRENATVKWAVFWHNIWLLDRGSNPRSSSLRL